VACTGALMTTRPGVSMSMLPPPVLMVLLTTMTSAPEPVPLFRVTPPVSRAGRLAMVMLSSPP